MPTDPAPAPDTAATPAESDIARIVGEEVGRQLNGRLKESLPKAIAAALAGELPKVLDQLKAKPTDAPAASAGNPATDGNSDKLTLKALNEQVAALNARLAASDKARVEAEASAREAKLGAAVRAEMAKHVAAEMVGPLFDSLHGVKRRFDLDADGNPGVKFRRDGYEEILPLDVGFKELAGGELKPYVAARTAGLPPAGVNGRGTPVRPPAAPQGVPFFMNELLSEVGKDRPELAGVLADQAAATQRR